VKWGRTTAPAEKASLDRSAVLGVLYGSTRVDDGNPRHLQDWISVHEQAGVKVVLTLSDHLVAIEI